MLTLQRGVSAWASWTFQPSDAGTEITVGSAPGCDWQVAAPGVPAIELLFTGEELFVWVEQAREELCCNDATLSLGFTRLRHADRLDLGPARIVVSLGADLAQSPAPSSSRPRRSRSAPGRSKGPVHIAELRVRRGSARLPVWAFTADQIGKSVTIGASDACDLQVIAAGVEPNELTVLCAGDTLLVKSARSEGPKLNGRYLPEEWQFLRDGDRLDLGTACIGVRISAIDLAARGERTTELEPMASEVRPEQRRAFREVRPKHTWPFAGKLTSFKPITLPKALAQPQERRLVSAAPTNRVGKRSRPLAAAPSRRPDYATVPQALLCTPRTLREVPLPSAVAPSRRRPPVCAQADSGSQAELLGCLFESPSERSHPRRWRTHAVSFVLLAGAYLVWLAILERW